jgi:hypothetical protein
MDPSDIPKGERTGEVNWACGTPADRLRSALPPAGIPVDDSAAEEQRQVQASPGLDGEL